MKIRTRMRIANIDIELDGDMPDTSMFRRRYGRFITAPTHTPPRSRIELVHTLAGPSAWTTDAMVVRRTRLGVELRSEGFSADISEDCAHAIVHAPLSERAIDSVLRYVLAQCLLEENALLLHASAVLIEGAAVLFVGPSGAGKTTLAHELGARILGDEAIALRRVGSHLVAHATPYWTSEQNCAQVSNIFFIEQGLRNEVIDLSAGRALAGLVQNSGPTLPVHAEACMQSAQHLVAALPRPTATLRLDSISSITRWLQPQLTAPAAIRMVGWSHG